jgi:hypothetical protein
MPFRHVKDSYQPEQLNKLTAAFDLVWPRIMPANAAATELDWLHERLANFIIACASQGQFEPEKLRQSALRAFRNRWAA